RMYFPIMGCSRKSRKALKNTVIPWRAFRVRLGIDWPSLIVLSTSRQDLATETQRKAGHEFHSAAEPATKSMNATTDEHRAAEPQPKNLTAENAELVPGSARFQRAQGLEHHARRMRALP